MSKTAQIIAQPSPSAHSPTPLAAWPLIVAAPPPIPPNGNAHRHSADRQSLARRLALLPETPQRAAVASSRRIGRRSAEGRRTNRGRQAANVLRGAWRRHARRRFRFGLGAWPCAGRPVRSEPPWPAEAPSGRAVARGRPSPLFSSPTNPTPLCHPRASSRLCSVSFIRLFSCHVCFQFDLLLSNLLAPVRSSFDLLMQIDESNG